MGCPRSALNPSQLPGFYRSRTPWDFTAAECSAHGIKLRIKLDHDCIWDAAQERDWRERRFLRVEKEGFRDPVRGKSGTVR